MSQPDRCPHMDDLVLLLPDSRGEGPAELSRHVALCPACAGELRSLEEGFAVLGDGAAPGPFADPHLLRRIEDAILPSVSADLARQQAPAFVRRRVWQGLALLGALFLVLGLVLTGTGGWTGPVELLHGVSCLALFAVAIVAPVIVLRLVLPAPEATWAGRGALRGALSGMVLSAGGVALQRAFCQAAALPHALLFHLGPVLLSVAVAAWLGRWAAAVHVGQGVWRKGETEPAARS